MPESLSQIIDSLRATAEPTRLRLLAICSEGELTVSEITLIVGQSQPRVSRHLKLLCNAGLLIRFREGHYVLYRVPAKGDGAALVQQILAQLPHADEQLEQDQRRMAEIKAERARRAADYQHLGSMERARLHETNVANSAIKKAVFKILKTDRIGELLDIGTGTGRMLELLGEFSASAVGVDISPEMLVVARSNLHAAGLGKVMVRRADMYGLPYPDTSFDTVTVDHVLYYAEDPLGAICEAARVLRPNGQLLVVDFMQPAGEKVGPGITSDNLQSWLRSAELRLVDQKKINGQSVNVLLSVAVPRRRRSTAAA